MNYAKKSFKNLLVKNSKKNEQTPHLTSVLKNSQVGLIFQNFNLVQKRTFSFTNLQNYHSRLNAMDERSTGDVSSNLEESNKTEKSPKSLKKTFYNQCFDKGRLKNFVLWFLVNYGEHKTVTLVEQLKTVGFDYASKAGISLGVDDLKIPERKTTLIFDAEKQTRLTVNQYVRGEITGVERFQRLIDTWHRTSEILKQEVIEHFEATDLLNPVYMMAFSGARGNISQVRQLVGMRGLMADPQGQIIDFPIRSNFREGLTLTEYIISSYGARKGIVDTALRTANAGYLTRRLVDVAQHVIISNFDCGTRRGIFLINMKEGNKTIHSLTQRSVGRILARDLYVSVPDENVEGRLSTGEKKIKLNRNEEITLDLAFTIGKKVEKIFVRSPLTCETSKLICQLCYGWSLAQGNLVSIGEAVGVVAAQSIGEPGTQLTMRTFHTGGVFSGDISDQIRAPFDGVAEYISAIPGTLIRTPEGKIAFLTKGEGSFFVRKVENGVSTSIESKKYKIPFYTLLYIRNGQKVYEKEVIAQISSISRKKNATDDAELTIKSEYEGQFYSKLLAFREKQVGPKLNGSKSSESNKSSEFSDHQNTEVHIPTKSKKKTLLKPTVLNESSQFEKNIVNLYKETALQNFSTFEENKAIEKFFEAWTWGYAWILSGKIYELKYTSPIFPKLGDVLNFKSSMNQTNWRFSLNAGSANMFFANKSYLRTLNTQSLTKSSQKSNVSLTNAKRQSSILTHSLNPLLKPFVSQSLLFFDINKILYKKEGYIMNLANRSQFFLLNKNSKNLKDISLTPEGLTSEKFQSQKSSDYLFYLKSLNSNQTNHLYPYVLQWFPSLFQLKTPGYIFFEPFVVPPLNTLNPLMTSNTMNLDNQRENSISLKDKYKQKFSVSLFTNKSLTKLNFFKELFTPNLTQNHESLTMSFSHFQTKSISSTVKQNVIRQNLLNQGKTTSGTSLSAVKSQKEIFGQTRKPFYSPKLIPLLKYSLFGMRWKNTSEIWGPDPVLNTSNSTFQYLTRYESSISNFLKQKKNSGNKFFKSKNQKKLTKFYTQSNLFHFYSSRTLFIPNSFFKVEKTTEKPLEQSAFKLTFNLKNYSQFFDAPLFMLTNRQGQYKPFSPDELHKPTRTTDSEKKQFIPSLSQNNFALFKIYNSKIKRKTEVEQTKSSTQSSPLNEPAPSLRKTSHNFNIQISLNKFENLSKNKQTAHYSNKGTSIRNLNSNLAVKIDSFNKKDFGKSFEFKRTRELLKKVNVSLAGKKTSKLSFLTSFCKRNSLLTSFISLSLSHLLPESSNISKSLISNYLLDQYTKMSEITNLSQFTLVMADGKNYKQTISIQNSLQSILEQKKTDNTQQAHKTNAFKVMKKQYKKHIMVNKDSCINKVSILSDKLSEQNQSFKNEKQKSIQNIQVKKGWLVITENVQTRLHKQLIYPGNAIVLNNKLINPISFDVPIYLEYVLLDNSKMNNTMKKIVVNDFSNFSKSLNQKNLKANKQNDFSFIKNPKSRYYFNEKSVFQNAVSQSSIGTNNTLSSVCLLIQPVKEFNQFDFHQELKNSIYNSTVSTLENHFRTLTKNSNPILSTNRIKKKTNTKLNGFKYGFKSTFSDFNVIKNTLIVTGKKNNSVESLKNKKLNVNEKSYLINQSFESVYKLKQYHTSDLNKQKRTAQPLAKYPSSDISIIPNNLTNLFVSVNQNNETISKQKWISTRVNSLTYSKFRKTQHSFLVCRKPLNVSSFMISYTKPFGKNFPFKYMNSSFAYQRFLRCESLLDPLILKKFSNLLKSYQMPSNISPSTSNLNLNEKSGANLFSLYPLIPRFFENPCFLFNLISNLNLNFFNSDMASKGFTKNNLVNSQAKRLTSTTRFTYSYTNKLNSNDKIATTSYYSPFNGEVVYITNRFKNNVMSDQLLDFNKDLTHTIVSDERFTKSVKNSPKSRKKYFDTDTSFINPSCMVLTKNDLISYYFPSSFSEYKEILTMNQKKKYKINDILISFLNMTDINLSNLQRYLPSDLNKTNLKVSQLMAGTPLRPYSNLLGDFFVYGDQISKTMAVGAAGQIIHYNDSKITLRRSQPILVSPKGILHKFDGEFIDPKTPVITLSYQRLKTGDIIQGIPKVEQFFEARTTKRGRLFRDSLPSLLKALFKRYQSKLPLDLAVRQSFYKIQQIIVDGVQRVYKSQGVTIADKHLEVIVKQMTSKVRIIDGAQTGFFPGEVVDLEFVEKINSFLIKKITYEPLVLGITKASLEVDSFLSAASFQQTTRVLSKAAISRKKDFLKGLKENVILGNLIPAGTGFLVYLNDFD